LNDKPALVWFDRDLRLADNAALRNAAATGSPILPVFVWSPEEEAPWAPGGASRWWLHQSLEQLEGALAARNSRLILRRGPAAESLLSIAAETGAASVFWNRRYEPAALARDRRVERALGTAGISSEICPGNVLFEPGTVLNGSGKPFQVFTAFWSACLGLPAPNEPCAPPAHLRAPLHWPSSLVLSDLRLEPEIDWAGGLRETWKPGEAGASRQLKEFLHRAINSYAGDRDRPDRRGTSRLSPYLHFGEISARQIWHAVRRARRAGGEAFLRELAWREFSYHLLFHFPRTAQEPLRPEFRHFRWRVEERALQAWTRGQTGYPLVDAGMRELWHTGWMHNRVRMLAASFLVKHLLIPWQEGAAWFWDTLVDADLANNTMGWQWTAGCGADAAPYFRIFNPVLQGEKFDPEGAYIRRWVPELASLPAAWIHQPWRALAGSAKDYPRPIVEHQAARKRALAALASMRKQPGGLAAGGMTAPQSVGRPRRPSQ
jgi:deoxyribodipyrimidine photo-lyase